MRSTFAHDAAEEEVLVCRVRGGDTNAFSELVRKHHVAVRRYLTSFVRDAAVADDLAEDVFVAALRDIGAYETRTRFAGWLFGIARHRAQMHLRSESRRSAQATKLGFALLVDIHARDVDPREYEEELSALDTCFGRYPAPRGRSHSPTLFRCHSLGGYSATKR